MLPYHNAPHALQWGVYYYNVAITGGIVESFAIESLQECLEPV